MNRLTGMLLGLSLAMLLGSPIFAEVQKADGKKAQAEEKPAEVKKAKGEAKEGEAKKAAEEKQANPKRKRASLAEMKLKELAKIELTDDQKKQIQDLAAEVEPRLKEAQKKVDELIPAETRKARQEALAKAKAEGKKPEDVVTAFKLTEEQVAAQNAVKEIQQTFNKQISEVLTPEQKQALKKARQERGEKKVPDGEKKPEAKKETAPKKAEVKEPKAE